MLIKDGVMLSNIIKIYFGRKSYKSSHRGVNIHKPCQHPASGMSTNTLIYTALNIVESGVSASLPTM